MRKGKYSFGAVTIPASSSLIFDDADIVFKARHIDVHGSLLIGSPSCPIMSSVTLRLVGIRSSHTAKG